MKLKEVREILNAELLTSIPWEDIEVSTACGSDLMNDVQAFIKYQALLLTGYVSPQTIHTAKQMEMKAIAFVRGKRPSQEMLELANQLKLVILSTDYPMFTACGRLYEKGLAGRGDNRTTK